MTSPLEGRVLVVLHRLEASVGCYDVASGRELFRLPTADYPHELCLAPDRRRLFVTEYGLRGLESEGEGGNTVAVFDLRSRMRVGTLSTRDFRRPHGIVADGGGRLYVTSEPRRSLLIFRLEDQTILHVVDVEQDCPHLVAVSPDGRTAVTANARSGSLSGIDVMMGVVLRQVEVLERPEGLAFSPDGRLLYVANRDSDAISIVDTVELKTVGRIDTGRGPVRLAVFPEGNRMALSLLHANAVQVADTRARRVIHTIPVGREPAGMALTDDGEVLFVSCELERQVYVISPAEGEILSTLATGEGPDAMVCLESADLG